MNSMAYQARELVEWSVATRPMPGQSVSGDLHLVHPLVHGVLLAVVDGVGHGTAAAAAAAAAVSLLEQHATEPVDALTRRCHEALAHTRGVVMTLAAIDSRQNSVSWLGVGNVEGRLLHYHPRAERSSECVLLRGGVVGYQLPRLHAQAVPLAAGDLLVLATDGIRPDFTGEVDLTQTPEETANRVVRQYYGGKDDALVLVARYRGEPHE